MLRTTLKLFCFYQCRVGDLLQLFLHVHPGVLTYLLHILRPNKVKYVFHDFL